MKRNIRKALIIIILLILTKDLFILVYNEYKNKEEISSYYNNPTSYNTDMMILKIPSISLKRIVLLADDNFSNLDNNIVYYKSNNYNKTIILFGHSGMGYGTFFNRIDELKVGDKCYLDIKNKKITYQLVQKRIISKYDTDILNTNEIRKLLLVTCLKSDKDKRLVLEFDVKCIKTLKNKQKNDIFTIKSLKNNNKNDTLIL